MNKLNNSHKNVGALNEYNEEIRRLDNLFGVGPAVDEARFNLATRIMSNGVEVIVASDKSTLPGGQPNHHLRILSTSEQNKLPVTLAPSTLKDHMLLMLPQSTDTANGDHGLIENTEVRMNKTFAPSYPNMIFIYIRSTFNLYVFNINA